MLNFVILSCIIWYYIHFDCKHPLPTTKEKTLHMNITRWSTPKSDWLYSLQPKMDKLYRVSKNKTGSWLWLRSWTPYCQIQTLIEVGKTTKSFRYDLNQIPHDYTVEVRNRFKGLDLIDRVPDELWTEVHGRSYPVSKMFWKDRHIWRWFITAIYLSVHCNIFTECSLHANHCVEV